MIQWPWVAAVIGDAFTVLFLRRRTRASAWAAIAWVAYAAYEYGMKMRVLCSGECNIRVDLLVIWPALFVVGVIALWRTFHSGAACTESVSAGDVKHKRPRGAGSPGLLNAPSGRSYAAQQ